MEFTLGELIENNINSKEDLEIILDKKGITNIEERQSYIKNYEKMMESIRKINDVIPKDFKKIVERITIKLKPLDHISKSLSTLFKPLYEKLTEISKQFEKIIPSEWRNKLLTELKKNKMFYLQKLEKSYSIFKTQFTNYKGDNDKQLILFSQYILYFSSIFENYTKKLILIFRNQPKELKKRLHRKEMKRTIKKFYNPIEISYNRLFGYLYNFADNIKHEDSKFYKRYSNLSSEEIMNVSNEFYNDLKLYLEKSLVSFFIIKVRLKHK